MVVYPVEPLQHSSDHAEGVEQAKLHAHHCAPASHPTGQLLLLGPVPKKEFLCEFLSFSRSHVDLLRTTLKEISFRPPSLARKRNVISPHL